MGVFVRAYGISMQYSYQTEEEFLREVYSHANKPPFNFIPSGQSLYCHDATWALAWSLDKAIITCKIRFIVVISHIRGSNHNVLDQFSVRIRQRIEQFHVCE